MDAREKAIAELKRQMAEQRARIDPEVLKKAQKAAAQSQKPPAQRKADMVPFDREAAARVVKKFLENHDDPEALARALKDRLRDDK